MAAAPANEDENTKLLLRDLPDEVLALVASGLTQPEHIASLAATARRMRDVSRKAPLSLRLRERPSPEAEPPSACSAHVQVQASLHALCRSFPGTVELCCSNLPLDDGDVAHAVAHLPSLATLHLTGCKKLTTDVVATLVGAPAMRSLFMQRCFQLRADALTVLLGLGSASRAPNRLVCLALSHLDLSEWDPPQAEQHKGSSSLQALALHNCTRLSPTGLAAVAAACPALHVLCLGGCSLAALANAAEKEDATEEDAGSLRQRLMQAALDLDPEGAAPVGTYGAWLRAAAVQLALAACRLPHLRVLEVTFCAPGLPPLLQLLLECSVVAGQRQHPIQVWDLCTSLSAEQAHAWRSRVALAARAAPLAAPSLALSAKEAAALVQAAARCSSGGRATALHAAAEEGNVARAEVLLQLGGEVDARDRSGASSCFSACEAGHAGVTRCLLAAGANVTLRNTAGEAPLYIAALRGHEAVVEVLLAHFRSSGVDWRDARMYGDGWTPLHAAAVGGRSGVVARLLAAAGTGAAQLVHAANRYGQTPIHIAARKGSPALLQSLVDAGGASSLLAADADGRTAAEVARRNGNASVWRMLLGQGRLEQQRLRGATPTAEKARRGPERQTGQWVGRRLQQRRQAAV